MSEGAKSYWDFIEPRWDIFNIHDGPEAFEASIREAPRPVVLLYAAHFCQSEVNNGDFSNSSGTTQACSLPRRSRVIESLECQ